MASGMGMPSIGIYSYELFHFFGVENILRIGSTGSLGRTCASGPGDRHGCLHQFQLRPSVQPAGHPGPIADFAMLRIAVECAEALGVPTHVGNILSSDAFYGDDPTANERWRRMGVLCVEMEAAALYMNAARGESGLWPSSPCPTIW
jgi:purine-nucleoside phosphorylase